MSTPTPVQILFELKVKFLKVAGALSPENLTCDGELRGPGLVAKLTKLNRAWRQLEAQAGRAVTVSEAESWLPEIQALEMEQRRLEMTRCPSHPLLVLKEPWRWHRIGAEKDTPSYFVGYAIDIKTYIVSSDFSSRLFNCYRVADCPTLDSAVAAGEALLKQVTYSAFKQRTRYIDDAIHYQLSKLPPEYRQTASTQPKAPAP